MLRPQTFDRRGSFGEEPSSPASPQTLVWFSTPMLVAVGLVVATLAIKPKSR